MRTHSMLRHPSAFVPLLMSFTALAVVLGFLAWNGSAPQPDEDAPPGGDHARAPDRGGAPGNAAGLSPRLVARAR